ncbi:translation initiation factor IF-2 N-terminal domain-containing protein, partial [Mitsuokella multacida]
MSKYRVYELAKEFNTDSKVILDILKRNKFKAANNFSSVGEEERTAIKNSLSNKGA